MYRRTLLALGDSPRLKRLVTGIPVTRRMSRRFVAGETLQSAVEASRETNARGLLVTLNYLGEFVDTREAAVAARETYRDLFREIAEGGLRAGVSVKLTQLGQKAHDAVLQENLEVLLTSAREHGVFVRFDMESADLVDPTLATFTDLWQDGWRQIGIVLQSYLKRTTEDVRRVAELGAPVRVCKGAYSEGEDVAYQEMDRIRAAFEEQVDLLLASGTHTAIATHDPRLIDAARSSVRKHSAPATSYEFQQLYGVRRDLQQELRDEGHAVRVYIPFGEMWYPYLMRRLAERPQNLFFMVGSVARESPVGRLFPGKRKGLGGDGPAGWTQDGPDPSRGTPEDEAEAESNGAEGGRG